MANTVDYDVLANGITVYSKQAEAINETLQALISMNGELSGGWVNDTATAFLERFEDEYKPALQNISEAVQSISDAIQSYMSGIQEFDQSAASQIRG